MAKEWRFNINADAIAQQVQQDVDSIYKDLQDGVRDLTAQTHSKVVELASQDLKGFQLQHFMGEGGKNISWNQVSDNIFVVAIDPSVGFYDSGRAPTSMATESWLLKNAKTAKDGCVLNPRNKVLTSLGWKRIKDIKAGDMVLTHSGKFREVKQLLVRPTEIGTEYVNFRIKSFDASVYSISSKCSDYSELTCPRISLTTNHPVLTPDGWKDAGILKNGDLIATPADLKRLCKECGAPIPINVKKYEFCLNNSCCRSWSSKNGTMPLGRLTKEQRSENARKGNRAAKESGVFDRPDWGARNPETLKKLRDASNMAMREKISTGEWGPEVFFEKQLKDLDISFIREFPIKTDRVVNAGAGRTRMSTLFVDFYFPDLKLAIELDGKHWHDQPEAKERDLAKNSALHRDGIQLIRIPSHEIYRDGERVAKSIKLWTKNHSGELGVAWVKVSGLKRGTVSTRQHVYANKYDICLDAEEHSFCCETVFIHNSKYKVIPFKHDTRQSHGSNAVINTMAKNAIRQARTADNKRIPLYTIEKNADGTPRIGTLHKIPVQAPFTQSQAPHLYSKPRSQAESLATGLKQHSGIFKLEGLAVSQRMVGPKVKREAVTFRVVSSKSQAEGRWMYPAIPAGRYLERAFEWATTQAWPDILKKIGKK